jgi:hypothetical protein
MPPSLPGFDRVKGLRVDIRVGRCVFAAGDETGRCGVDADTFDRTPVELAAAFIVLAFCANRLSKRLHGAHVVNELQRVDSARIGRHEPQSLPGVESAAELGWRSARAGERWGIGLLDPVEDRS